MQPDFASLGLSESLLAVVAELGYELPTPIQVQSIPSLLAGEDLVGQSDTGSGKTAAFCLPILQRLELDTRKLQALLICPTRELSAQVARELRKLGRKHKGLAILEIVGGQPVRAQIDSLNRGVHVVVGTPGRLLDHLRRNTLDSAALKTVVLDEADRMLDMGFGADVEAILRELPKSRQTLLFSATFPGSIEALSQKYQRDAKLVNAMAPQSESSDLRQFFVETDADNKLEAFYWAMAQYPHESVLVFCNFKKTVAQLEETLHRDGFSVDRLDGDLEQYKRDQVLARFRNQSLRILIATDVAGRGIDVENLDLVINYELPPKGDIYVHRIGRTGRAGKAGIAVSLASKREFSKIPMIEEATGRTVERAQPKSDFQLDLGKLARDADMRTILISGGRKDKIRPGDILGALTGDAGGLRGQDIGKIEVQDRLTYVAVASAHAQRATKSINGGRIKKKRYKATMIG